MENNDPLLPKSGSDHQKANKVDSQHRRTKTARETEKGERQPRARSFQRDRRKSRDREPISASHDSNVFSLGEHVRHLDDRTESGHAIQLFKRVKSNSKSSKESANALIGSKECSRKSSTIDNHKSSGHVVQLYKNPKNNTHKKNDDKSKRRHHSPKNDSTVSSKKCSQESINDRPEIGHFQKILKTLKNCTERPHELSRTRGGLITESKDGQVTPRKNTHDKRHGDKVKNDGNDSRGSSRRRERTHGDRRDRSGERARPSSEEEFDKTVKTLYVKKKFNVLMVADQIKNDEYDRRFVDTCIVLCQEGHNVTILSTHILTTQCFEIRHYCRKIHEVGKWLPRHLCGAARSFCFYLRSAYLALWAYMHLEPKPDLVLCNCVNISAMRLFRWIRNCRLLTFFQVFNYNQMPRASSEYNIQPKYNSKFDATFLDEVLCSNLLTKLVFQYTYKANGVPISVLYPTVRRPLVVSIDYTPMVMIPQKSYTFLSFYNLVPSSKFEMAIKAFGIMYGSLEDSIRNRCYLILIGHYRKNKENEKYLQRLKNQILCMNMQDRIFILNNVQHGLMRNLMGMCHAYIHTQNYAVCEDNIIEAMAAGRPVIATNTGFPCEVIKHKETGYLLPLDAELFADAMIDLLVHPQRYKNMCASVQDVYEQNFSFSYFVKCINRIVNKYDENLINNSSNTEYKISQDVIDLNNALEEIHRFYTNLPNINVLVTHQELITDRFYTVEKFYEDIPALYP